MQRSFTFTLDTNRRHNCRDQAIALKYLIHDSSPGMSASLRREPVIELLCSSSEFFAARWEFLILFIPDVDPQPYKIERDEKCSQKKDQFPNAHVGPVAVEDSYHEDAEHSPVTRSKKRANALFGYHRIFLVSLENSTSQLLKTGHSAH